MDLNEAIATRRAVRDYKPDAIDDATIRALIDAAIQAPSAMNEQPWTFTVVRSRPLLDRISQEAKAHMLRTTPAGLLSHHLSDILADKSFQIFYHAPALIVISSRSEGPWAIIDCTLAAQNLMLAARERGLGSCWIGFAQSWLGTPAGREALKLPPSCVPVAPIIVGYPVAFPATVARKPAEINWIAA
ncbi:MAG: nitroreductase [Pseudolabrys sp.]|nr:nitroreductase [Pseudolabrys sp.]